MRVTVLGQFFPPETFAGANRIHALATALGRESEVTVVAPRPSYPRPSLYVDAPELPAPDGVRVIRTGTFSPHDHSWLGRALAEQRMALRLSLAAADSRPDAVLASSPGMFLGPAGLGLARLHRVPFVWDVRDITWEYGREVTAGSRAASLAAARLSTLMWAVARQADLVVTATPGIAEMIRTRRPDAPVVLIPNTIAAHVLQLLDPSDPPPSARPLVTYAGLVGRPQALVVLCEVAARLPDADFAVVGEGPELEALVADARRRSLRNIQFLGYLPQHRLATVYHRSQVLFAQLHASAVHTTTALPSKLFEYMAAGRPIVYAGDGLAAETVRRIGCGVTVPPGDAAAVAAAIRSLLQEPADARAQGLAGRRFAERQPSREDAMAALMPELRRLVHKPRTAVAAA